MERIVGPPLLPPQRHALVAAGDDSGPTERACRGVRMEMHQVRYFLAVARTLNFTKAAEECHVAQPSLTRAIKLLEGELGGDLFRRERPRAMLTPLGERMFPLLKQCYDSAQSARALAAMINDGEVGALKLAVSNTIELGLILNHVNELRKSFNDVELKILRGTEIGRA